jgi:hypothetical protein
VSRLVSEDGGSGENSGSPPSYCMPLHRFFAQPPPPKLSHLRVDIYGR